MFGPSRSVLAQVEYYTQHGEIDAASTLTEQALSLAPIKEEGAPTHAELLNVLGVLRIQQNRIEEGVSAFQEAYEALNRHFESVPSCAAGLIEDKHCTLRGLIAKNLSQTLRAQNDFEEAKEFIEQALMNAKKDSERLLLLFELGEACWYDSKCVHDHGDTELLKRSKDAYFRGLNLIDEAESLAAYRVRCFYGLARIHKLLDQPILAESHFEYAFAERHLFEEANAEDFFFARMDYAEFFLHRARIDDARQILHGIKVDLRTERYAECEVPVELAIKLVTYLALTSEDDVLRVGSNEIVDIRNNFRRAKIKCNLEGIEPPCSPEKLLYEFKTKVARFRYPALLERADNVLQLIDGLESSFSKKESSDSREASISFPEVRSAIGRLRILGL